MVDRPARIFIGTSGWSYADWRGIVYPERPAPRDELRFLAGYVDALEVNSSFYRTPPPKMTASWVRRTADLSEFRFTFKLNRLFTHDRAAWSAPDAQAFRDAVAPVAEAGKLAAVLLQFPWSFRAGEESYQYLHRLRDEFGGHWPLAIEVRHNSWLAEEALYCLRLLKMSVANIDQPALNRCIAPGTLVTGPLGYVRLHGRREDTWFVRNAEPSERYNYLYRDDELDEWISRVRDIARRTEEVYVFANNHYRGKAPANAFQMMANLRKKRVEVPDTMFREFPFLEAIAARPQTRRGEQGRLF